MPVDLVLVQHGEKADAPPDPPLTERGLRQAQACGRALAPHSVAAIYSSPARRAAAPSNGDSSATVGARMADFVTDPAIGDATGLVVAVTHGGATVDLLRTLLGDDALQHAAAGLIGNGVPGGALTWLRVGGAAVAVGRIADVRHIPADDRTGHAMSPEAGQEIP